MKKRILVIEDNEQNLYLITFLLEHRGYEVTTARDGIAGIRTAVLEIPDLILLDIQLPRMNGYVVAERLRESSALAHVPIVAVTSYAMAGDREKAMASGCSGYIVKPINPDTFLSEVETYLAAT
jgi:two-component system, cell cycle response regulator DivK